MRCLVPSLVALVLLAPRATVAWGGEEAARRAGAIGWAMRRRGVLDKVGVLSMVSMVSMVSLLATACGAPARPSLPSGTGVPFPAFDTAYQQAIQECAGVRTITAELALSGRAGQTKIRGRINAGFAEPGDMILEGPAPFGKPAFLLAVRGSAATLVLPRDARVLRGAEPAAIVEALAGVALAPADLRTAVAGCGLGTAAPGSGRSYGNDWAAADSSSGTVYLRRADGRWRVAGAEREGITVQYADFAGGRASTVFVRARVADLTLRLSQVEINVPLDPRIFDVEVPKNAEPLTLDELRRAGPLGEKGTVTVSPGPKGTVTVSSVPGVGNGDSPH